MWHILQTCFDGEEMGTGEHPRHTMMLPREYKDYTTFATIRNPYTRFLSQYNFFGQGDAIEKFLKGGWPSITKELEGMRLDYVVRLENLEEDFYKLPFVRRHQLFFPPFQFPRWTVSKELFQRPMRVSYNQHVQKEVRARCHEDFENFPYDPDDLSVLEPLML